MPGVPSRSPFQETKRYDVRLADRVFYISEQAMARPWANLWSTLAKLMIAHHVPWWKRALTLWFPIRCVLSCTRHSSVYFPRGSSCGIVRDSELSQSVVVIVTFSQRINASRTQSYTPFPLHGKMQSPFLTNVSRANTLIHFSHKHVGQYSDYPGSRE